MQNINLSQTIPELRKSDWTGAADLYGSVLAPAAMRPYAVLEVLVGMGLVLACGYLARPHDPLFMQSEFPWIWLAATFFALRYGAILGVLGGLCVAAAWYFFHGAQEGAYFPLDLFVGGMAQLVIVGHFCDLWHGRLRRLKALNTYLDDSLRSLTNHHYLLKVSHERLERDTLVKPFTLRDACEYLHGLPRAHDAETLPNAEAMLSFVATGCQLDEASVFAVDGQSVNPLPIATVGMPFELDAADVLVQACIRQKSMVHLRQADGARSHYLVCAPIMAASGRLLGILVVRRMSFLSLNEENLRLLLALLSYYAGGIEQGRLLSLVRHSLPACPEGFAIELARLASLQQRSGIKSSLAGLVVPRGAGADAMMEQIEHAHRMLDLVWAYDLDNTRVAIVLLPLTDDVGVNGYLARVELTAQAQFNASLEAANVTCYRGPVDISLPGFGLTHIVARCNRHG